MTQTGKKARRQFGTRYAAKRAKARRRSRKRFGALPVSESRGNAAPFRSGLPDDMTPLVPHVVER